MSKPRVFISSTVKDLKDIRNALKFWLEEKGFEVYLSEASDLPRDSKLFTIESCLELVRRAEFYILIVGDWAGWTPEGETKTITHLEFLESLKDSTKASHVFLRKSVDVAYKEKSDSVKTEPLITEFYKQRSSQGGQWINYFEDFEDIAKVLSATLSLTKSISQKALEKMIIFELEGFLTSSIVKMGKTVSRVSDDIRYAVQSFNLDKNDFNSDREIEIDSLMMMRLTLINFTYLSPRNKSFPALHAAAVNDSYVDFSRTNGEVSLSELLIRIQTLNENLRFIFSDTQDERLQKHYENLYVYYSENKDGAGKCNVPVRLIALCLAQFIRFGQTCLEAESVYNHLKYGDPLNTKSLSDYPTSPFIRNNQEVVSEKATPQDLVNIREKLKARGGV